MGSSSNYFLSLNGLLSSGSSSKSEWTTIGRRAQERWRGANGIRDPAYPILGRRIGDLTVASSCLPRERKISREKKEALTKPRPSSSSPPPALPILSAPSSPTSSFLRRRPPHPKQETPVPDREASDRRRFLGPPTGYPLTARAAEQPDLPPPPTWAGAAPR